MLLASLLVVSLMVLLAPHVAPARTRLLDPLSGALYVMPASTLPLVHPSALLALLAITLPLAP